MKDLYQKLAEALDVKEITDNFLESNDLSVSSWSTADGYDVYVMTEDPRNLNFESDVFYYQPQFDEIIDRISDNAGMDAVVYIEDLYDLLPEEDVEDYLDNLQG